MSCRDTDKKACPGLAICFRVHTAPLFQQVKDLNSCSYIIEIDRECAPAALLVVRLHLTDGVKSKRKRHADRRLLDLELRNDICSAVGHIRTTTPVRGGTHVREAGPRGELRKNWTGEEGVFPPGAPPPAARGG